MQFSPLPLCLRPSLRLHQRPGLAHRRAFALRKAAFSALASLLFAPLAMADELATRNAEPPHSTWGLGVAVVSAQKAYTGSDRDTLAIPLVTFENQYVRVLGPSLEIKLPSVDMSASQQLDFGLVARYDRSGYKSDDAPVLSGMDERKDGVWAGARVTWHNPLADVQAEYVVDASGHSKGQRATLALEKTFHLTPQVQLVPRLGASWMSARYVDYYYGVRDHEVTAGRAAYVGKAGVNAELGARATYLINQSHSVFLDIGVASLAKEIKNSPLVDRSTENRLLVGYLYRF